MSAPIIVDNDVQYISLKRVELCEIGSFESILSDLAPYYIGGNVYFWEMCAKEVGLGTTE